MTCDPELLQAGFRYAQSLCHDRSDAKDLLQGAWLRVSGYPVLSKALLFTAIRHAFFDEQRQSRVVRLARGQSVGSELTHAQNALGHREELNAALGQLRPEERETIFLSVVEGYTAQEIALLSGQSRNSVLSLIRRGLAKLRARLDAPPPRAAAAEGKP
jgi:RNA polymerase sigma-70 factor (ECF subfamily)